ncbi:1913_t:CDS:2, partial [Ambispora leptoticha]
VLDFLLVTFGIHGVDLQNGPLVSLPGVFWHSFPISSRLPSRYFGVHSVDLQNELSVSLPGVSWRSFPISILGGVLDFLLITFGVYSVDFQNRPSCRFWIELLLKLPPELLLEPSLVAIEVAAEIDAENG